ncbi:hypothetical protein PROVRETT_09148 [Providencia rettgeri DSM 1131]|uniref:hypothetical protein n=1 Tax=Providencia rettgeri TaxID=587 RepID=UPI000197C06C|nr:hypothetical protein [Providencia rettgeri]EFE51983.1 hypothetical protein PROVRETT_09148 [Providencia rettgeri DSM 1131]QXA57659.1 hypothetical protein I6L79_20260 [Providencia rettgeri]
MATIIDALIVTLKLDNTGFKEETRKSTAESDRLSASLDNVNESSADLTVTIKNQTDETKKAKEQTEDFTRSIYNGVKALTAFFGTIMVSSDLAKLITDVNQANDKLNFLSKNLGMNATEVKKWQNMAEMAGGTADGMTASLSSLSKSLWDLVTIGDASVLPYFNALNVGVVDSTGNIRNLDDILLDVADSLSKMSRPQAYNIAKNMGFDEGTINTLLQGRDAMERQLIAQKNIVISSQEELEISRKLSGQNALVSQQWEGLKTLIANYLIPYFLKFSERLTAWLDYLNRNRDGAILIFKGIAAVIGLTLIPLALKAAIAFAGMFAPLFTGVGLILALGAAIVGLSNDYEVWKRGGKSMFDWSEWDGSITFLLEKLNDLESWFKDTTIGKWFTDQNGDIEGWKLALTGVGAYIGGKWAFGIIGALLRIGNVFKGLISMPTMLLAATAYALNDYKKYLDSLNLTPVTNKLTEGLISAGKTYHAVNVLKGDSTNEEKAKALRLVSGDYVPSMGVINTVIDSGLADRIVTDFKNGSLKDSAINLLKGKQGNNTDGLEASIAETHPERGLRYNSPLNLAYAKQSGASNDGNGWAKFDTEYDGIRASARQLMMYYNGTSAAADYKKLQTVWDIIHKWAPKGHGKNDPVHYSNTVAERMKVDPKEIIELNNPEVMYSLIREMSKMENNNKFPYSKGLAMAAIKGSGDPYANMANGLKSFNDYISNPLVPNRMPEIKQFLGQSDALRANAQTVTNNKVEATFGDINIQTSSPTVQGNIRDAVEVTNELLFQLVPPMN